MHTPIIISNTKSYIKNLKEFYKLQNDIWNNLEKENYKYYIAVPAPLISMIKKEEYKAFSIGAQNFTSTENTGKTGNITLSNILDAGANFVILGHSEVRESGETSEVISEKVSESVNKNILTVLCVGEKERVVSGEKYDTSYIDELLKMLGSSLKGVSKNNLEKLIISYEPVWAIGESVGASTEVVMQAIIIIRRELAKIFGIDGAKKIKIIYGGSVDEDNAKDYITNATCDGVLVGRASMNAKSFSKIINNLYK